MEGRARETGEQGSQRGRGAGPGVSGGDGWGRVQGCGGGQGSSTPRCRAGSSFVWLSEDLGGWYEFRRSRGPQNPSWVGVKEQGAVQRQTWEAENAWSP